MRTHSIWQLGLKRLMDVILSSIGMVVLAPIILCIALAVFVRMGRPVIFRQQRTGKLGKPFTMVKFRTMREARDERGSLLSDTHRLNPLGKFLRRTSLDELLELWNVIRGDMSLVGPRPLLVRYYPYFNEEEQLRFSVRPGITGLAQVAGRNQLSWDRRIEFDLQYVRGCSFPLDLKILSLTLLRVTRTEGVCEDPGAVMLDFDEERRRRGNAPNPTA